MLMAVKVFFGLVITAVFGWGIFALAGTWAWWPGWAYVGLLTVGQTAGSLYMRAKNPELIQRRGEFGEGTASWDKAVLGLFGFTYLAVALVAAWDAGHGGSGPLWMWPVGAALYAAGSAIVTRAMLANTHFEKTVRIQVDREHQVIDTGPYGMVRHPGYVGTILSFPLATAFLLLSWWALVPAAVCVGSLVLRTALEDRFLQDKLDGYADYAKRVRARLVPGVW